MTPNGGEFSGGGTSPAYLLDCYRCPSLITLSEGSATATSITHDSARDHLESAFSPVFPQPPSLPDDDSLPLQSDEEGADVEEDENENLGEVMGLDGDEEDWAEDEEEDVTIRREFDCEHGSKALLP